MHNNFKYWSRIASLASVTLSTVLITFQSITQIVSLTLIRRVMIYPMDNAITWAQLFEGRLALNPGLNFTRASISFVQKPFLGYFSRFFKEHPIINLLTKRIKLKLLSKLSFLNSNFALTQGYLNPALNNSALVSWC